MIEESTWYFNQSALFNDVFSRFLRDPDLHFDLPFWGHLDQGVLISETIDPMQQGPSPDHFCGINETDSGQFVF